MKDRAQRQIWRFEFEGRGYYLKFYPRENARLKRHLRGNPATREFIRLQALQRAGVPAPRAVAQLVGFKIRDVLGDAVVLEEITGATPLDEYISKYAMEGERPPNHRAIVRELIDLLRKLGQAKLGHSDLHLGNLLLRGEQLFLLDAYAVHFKGLRLSDVLGLATSVRHIATRTDLQRGWNALGPGGPMPARNPAAEQLWRKLDHRYRTENDYSGRIRSGPWRGIFFKRTRSPRRWAPASKLQISSDDWRRAWPQLLQQIESDQLTSLKRSPSGDVLAGEIVLGGCPVQVIVKRPYKRHWYRYLNEVGRGSRAWRAWVKAWTLVNRDIPTAWPIIVLEKRVLGYVTDSLIVLERVEGPTLARVNLNALSASHRDMLLRRAGRILREIDQLRLSHFDAKASNWIVQEDSKLGPRPILIDVDGIRFRRWAALGIERLLRSMLEHRQYTPADSLSLCQGYAPYSPSQIRAEPAAP